MVLAVDFPQYDNEISGASDLWDNELSGILLNADYFSVSPPSNNSGQIKVWNGSSWVVKPVKVWNGSSWVTKPVKRWNGTAWVATTY